MSRGIQRLYTVADASLLFGVSKSLLYRLCKQGRINFRWKDGVKMLKATDVQRIFGSKKAPKECPEQIPMEESVPDETQSGCEILDPIPDPPQEEREIPNEPYEVSDIPIEPSTVPPPLMVVAGDKVVLGKYNELYGLVFGYTEDEWNQIYGDVHEVVQEPNPDLIAIIYSRKKIRAIPIFAIDRVLNPGN